MTARRRSDRSEGSLPPVPGEDRIVLGAIERLARRAAGSCPEPERIVLYSEGYAEPGRARLALEAHLTACRACALEVERTRRALRGAPAMPAARPARPAPGGSSSLAERLRALVDFAMPRHAFAATRSGAGGTSAEVVSAMKDYSAGRFATAARRLEGALAAGDRTPELPFFLGVCRHREGDTAEAARLLGRAARLRPRIGEVHWFLGQARLASGDAKGALRALRRAATLPGPYRIRARALVRSVGEAARD